MRTEEHRIWHVLLSAAALLALTAQNASGVVWQSLQLGMVQWTQASRIAALTQWALPVLTALAGSIFLNAPGTWNLRTLWRRVVPAATLSCVFWWCAAAVIYSQKHYTYEIDISTFLQCLGMVLGEPDNIAFCQMLVSMFLLYPLLRLVAASRQVTGYCLAALFAVNLALPMLRLIPAVRTVTLFTSQLNWGYFRTWTFYLLLGAYLGQKEPSWPVRLVIYCAGIVSTGLMAALTSWQTTQATGYCADYIGLHSPFTAAQAAAVLVLFRHVLGQAKAPQLTRGLSGLWMCPPVAALACNLSARFLPAYDGHLLRHVLQHMAVDSLITLGLIAALTFLPGFRCLAGHYHAQGEKR